MSAFTVRGATAGPMHDTHNVGALSADIEARAELMEGYRVCAKCVPTTSPRLADIRKSPR